MLASRIAGSGATGDYVVIAGQSGRCDHVHVGDKAMLGAKCGVMNDIPPGVRVLGAPAIEEKEQYLVWAAMYKLPAMRKSSSNSSASLRHFQKLRRPAKLRRSHP
ncbi:MAG: hypothetical protein U0894_11215 [Pirellulales bacterium]